MTIEASVIIPTYNRSQMLRQALSALAGQDGSNGSFEVIVVDDGSTNDTPCTVDDNYPFPMRVIYQSNQGAAAARNAGACQARGEILIFLDDDIVVEPKFVASFVAERRAFPRSIILGREVIDVGPAPTLFAQYAAEEVRRFVGSQSAPIEFTHCATGLLCVSRDAFFEIGMMHDVAGDGSNNWGDVAFGYRAACLGFTFRRCAGAIGHHRDYSVRDLTAAMVKAEQRAAAAVALFHQYPAILPALPMFRDKTPLARDDGPGLIVRKLLRRFNSTERAMWGLEQLASLLERYLPSQRLLRPLYRWIIGGSHYRGYRQALRAKTQREVASGR